MSNVIRLPNVPKTIIECLRLASEAELSTIVILGFSKDGGMWSETSTYDGPETLWLLEKAKQKVLEA